jgi:NAD(P)-dependent dehydrogenase (short-subunit alcohol dehydrogenase family)
MVRGRSAVEVMLPGIDENDDTREFEMGKLTGKTALVTGGSRGIGQAIAMRLAAEGAEVAVHYGSNEDAAKATVDAIQRAGGRAFAVEALLGSEGDVDTLFTQLEAGLNGRKLDILVNNAGIGSFGPIQTATPEEFDRVFAINTKAPVFITQRALPLLADNGRIVNLSSCSARMAVTMEPIYAMSKAALDVFGRTLAVVLGDRGITVNNVAAGATHTDLTAKIFQIPGAAEAVASVTALGRIGQPDEIANVVAFLASDDAALITGATVDVSGGTWLGPKMPS